MLTKRNTRRLKSRLLLAALSLGILSGCGLMLSQNTAEAAVSTTNASPADKQEHPNGILVAVQERNYPTGVSLSPFKKGSSIKKDYGVFDKNSSSARQLQTPQTPINQQPAKKQIPGKAAHYSAPAPACSKPAASRNKSGNLITFTGTAVDYFSNEFTHIWGTLFMEDNNLKH